MRKILIAALGAALFAASASAMGIEPKPSSPSTPASSSTPDAALTPRQQAERWYADAYDEIAKANETARENAKAAEKKFKKALDRAMRATEADSTYHEAWNLVGYSLRKLGRLDDSVEAYARCLRLKPDYAAAREYLGEAYLELGNLDMAKKQLAVLERMNAEEPMATLKAAIDAYEKAHPAAPAGAGASGSH